MGLGLGKRPLLKFLLLIFSIVKKRGLLNIVVTKSMYLVMSYYNVNGYISENYNGNTGKRREVFER